MEQYFFSILLEYYDRTLDNGEKSNNDKNIDNAIRLVVLGHNSRPRPFLGVRSKWKRKPICFADDILTYCLTPSLVFNLLRFIRNTFSRWSYFVCLWLQILDTEIKPKIIRPSFPSANRVQNDYTLAYYRFMWFFFLHIGDGLNEKNVTPPFERSGRSISND